MKSIKRQKSFPAALSSLFRGGQTKESTAAMKAADDWPSPPLPAATGQIRGRLSIDNNKSHFYSNDNDGDIYTSFYNSNKNSNSSESTALATSNNPTLMMIGSTSAKRQQNELKDISYKKQSVSQDSQMDEEEDNIAKLIQLINDCDNLAISNSLAAVKQSASVSTANVQYAAEVNNSTKKPAAITSSSGSLNHLKPPLAVDRAVSSNSATSTINNGSSSFSINSMSPYPPSRPHHDDTSSGLTLFNSSAIVFGPRSSKTSFMDAPTVNSKRNGSDPQAILNLPREDVHAKFNKSYLPTLEQLDSHAQDHPSLYTGSSSSEKKDGDKHDKDNNNNNSSTSNDELSDASAGPGTISEIIDLVASATDTSYPPNYNCSRENSSNVARKRTTTGDSDQTLTRVVAYEDILDDYCAIFPSASSSPKSSDQPAVMTNKECCVNSSSSSSVTGFHSRKKTNPTSSSSLIAAKRNGLISPATETRHELDDNQNHHQHHIASPFFSSTSQQIRGDVQMVKIPSSTSNVPPHTTTSASTSTTEMKRVPPAITKKKSFFRIRNIFKRLISPKSTEEEEVEEGERESEVEKKKYSAHNAAGTLILPESSKNISSSSIVSPAFPPLPSTKTLSPSSDNQVQSRNIFKAGFMDEESEGLSADEDGGNDSRKRRSNNETTLGGGGSNNTVSSGTFSWLPNRKTLLSKKSMPNLKKSQWGGPNSVISLPIPPAVTTASASPPALVVTSDGATKAPLNSNMLNNHINSPLTNNLYPATSIVTTDAVSTPRPPSSTVYKGDLNSRPSSESMIIKYYENSDYSSASSQYLLPYLKNKNTLQQQNNDYYDSSKGSIGNFTNPHSNTVLQFPSPPTPPVITTTVPVSSDLHYNLLPELLKTNRSTLIGYAGESHDLATKYGLVLPDKSFSQRNMGGIAPPILPDQHLLLLQHQKRQQIEQQHLQLQQLVYAALAGGGFPDEDSTAVSHYDNNNHVDIDIEEVGVAAPQLLSLGDLTDSVHEEEPFTHPTDEISVSDAGSICSAKGVTASSAGNVQQGQINIEEEDLQSQDIEF